MVDDRNSIFHLSAAAPPGGYRQGRKMDCQIQHSSIFFRRSFPCLFPGGRAGVFYSQVLSPYGSKSRGGMERKSKRAEKASGMSLPSGAERFDVGVRFCGSLRTRPFSPSSFPYIFLCPPLSFGFLSTFLFPSFLTVFFFSQCPLFFSFSVFPRLLLFSPMRKS